MGKTQKKIFSKPNENQNRWEIVFQKKIEATLEHYLMRDKELSLQELERSSKSLFPDYENFGFKTFQELLMQLKILDFSVGVEKKVITGTVSKSSPNSYLFENSVKGLTQLVVHCEQHRRDLKIVDYVKEYRNFHKTDIHLENHPR